MLVCRYLRTDRFHCQSLRLLTFQHPLNVSDAQPFLVFLWALLELFSFHLSI